MPPRARSHVRAVLTVLLACLVVGAPAVAAPHRHLHTHRHRKRRPRHRVSAAAGPILGLSAAWDLGHLRAQQPHIAWLRYMLDWGAVEPQPGRFDWSAADASFANAARHGYTLLPLLFGTPRWSNGGATALPSDPSAYADYVAQAAARYGPGGTFWVTHPRLPQRPASYFEIWNEPYLKQFAEPGADPAAYARLFRAASAAGHNANPAARFLIAADTTGQTATMNVWVDWVDGMYAAVPDLNRYIDGVAVHPYSHASGPDYYTPRGDTRSQVRRIEQIHDRFAAHGAAGAPFWITEIGWSTCPSDPYNCVSEATQAAYVRRLIELARTNWRSFVQAIFLYRYRDGWSADPGNEEDWFGLVRRNGAPKPAWAALRAES